MVVTNIFPFWLDGETVESKLLFQPGELLLAGQLEVYRVTLIWVYPVIYSFLLLKILPLS